MVSFKSLTFIATVINMASSANILFLNGIASPSHHLWNRVLIRSLAEKGHNITMVSVDNDKSPQPNIHYIFLEATYETIYGGQDGIDLFDMADQSPLVAVTGIYEWCELCCDGILRSKGLDTILNYPDDFKFDIVINDFTCGPCLLPLIHKFNYPPVVAVTAFNNPPYTHHLTGGQKFPAFVPHFIINYPQIMSYPQRLFNALLYAVDDM
jgi:glucuronosyltransferase